MYATQQHCRLTPFYAVASPSQLQVNQESIRCLNCILAEYLPEFQLPTTLNVTTVDRYVNKHLSDSVINIVVDRLYQSFLLNQLISNDPSRRIWINFIHYISSTRLVPRLSNQLPVYKRTNEKLELFQNAALLTPVQLFAKFNPEYDRDLLTGIERWTYRSLRNVIYGQIRDRGEPLFGLKDLGVVAKLSPSYICNTRSRYVSKEQLISDTFLVKTFKNYLKISRVRTHRLTSNDWDKIHREVDQQWHRLELNSLPPSIEQIQRDLDNIGDCVRRASEMQPIDSLDREVNINSDNKQTLADTISAEGNIDVECPECLLAKYHKLISIAQSAITERDSIDRDILELHYREGLNQQQIGENLGEDQSSISRRLRVIYQDLIKIVHQQIDNPNQSDSKIDRTSIAAMKQLLKILYEN